MIRLPKYRIIKVRGVCPWQIQQRRWLLFWQDVYLSFSSISTAGKELTELLKDDEARADLKK